MNDSTGPTACGGQIDVTIPDDLAAAGWHWHGSALAHRDGLLFIHTSAYPLPGDPSDRPSCFDVARESNARAIAFAAARAERAVAPAKRRRPTRHPLIPPSVATTAQQLAMELV
jgi:hypothetical protein